MALAIQFRPFEDGDLKLLYKWLSKRKYRGKYLEPMYLRSLSGFRWMVRGGKFDGWYLLLRDGVPLGTLVHYVYPRQADYYIGIAIAEKRERRKGTGLMAMAAFGAYVLDKFDLSWVFMEADVRNEPMLKIAEMLGYSRIGEESRHLRVLGETVDVAILRARRDDMLERARRLLYDGPETR